MKNNTVRVLLTDLKGTETHSEYLGGLALYANIDTVQEARLDGITLMLELVNESEQDVEIANPIDTIQYMLLDAAGYPLKNPPSVSRIKTNPRDGSEDRLKEKFSIIAIRANGRDQNVEQQIKQKTIMLVVGASYTIILRINSIMEEGIPVPISPGTYTIVVTCSLVRTAGEEIDMQLLQSKGISINLR